MEATGCRIIVYGKRGVEFKLYDFADLHYLNRGMAKDNLRADIAKVKKDPYSLWFIGGDYSEFIGPQDPRFDPEAVDDSIRVNDLSYLAAIAVRGIVEFFNPIKDRGLGCCMGNHEFKHMSRHSEMFVHETLCQQLNVPNMRYSGWTDVYFVYRKGAVGCTVFPATKPPDSFVARLRVFIHHGAGAAATAGGKINRLKQLVDMVDADLVMMGHVHEQFAKAFVRLTPDDTCSEVVSKVTMGLITGSYLMAYPPGFTSYAEMRAYPPTTMGATRARYTPDTGELVVENRADKVGLRGKG